MDCMNCGGRLGPGMKFCSRCGAAAPAAGEGHGREYAPPPGGQMHSSFGGPEGAAASQQPRPRKSRAGKILLIVFGVLLVLGAGAVVAVYFGYKFIEQTVKESEPYRVAIEELRRSPAATEYLGSIKETGFPLGNIEERAGGTGSASFTVWIEGTKASGHYVVRLTRTGGSWAVTNSSLRKSDGGVIQLANGPVVVAERAAPPPPPPAAPGAANAVSMGPLDDKAVSKPEPSYPAIAKSARVGGYVLVIVTVDEKGRVVEARAASGHPLLQQSAVQAARRARFEPTVRAGSPVRVTGTLGYEFKLE